MYVWKFGKAKDITYNNGHSLKKWWTGKTFKKYFPKINSRWIEDLNIKDKPYKEWKKVHHYIKTETVSKDWKLWLHDIIWRKRCHKISWKSNDKFRNKIESHEKVFCIYKDSYIKSSYKRLYKNQYVSLVEFMFFRIYLICLIIYEN